VTLGARTPTKELRTTAPSIGVLTLPTLSCPWVDEAADCKASASDCRSSRARQFNRISSRLAAEQSPHHQGVDAGGQASRERRLQVYGADKFWKQISHEGVKVARGAVERLMRRLGLRGVKRGKVVPTTISDAKAPCPLTREPAVTS
jgi:hypothetical protein